MSGRRNTVLAPAGISQSTTAPWTIAQDVRAVSDLLSRSLAGLATLLEEALQAPAVKQG